MFTLFAFYVGAGIVSILIAVPLLMGTIKPNPFYGFRVKATLENSEVWYAVNRYFATHLIAASVIQLIASIGFYLIPGMSVDVYALAVLAVVVLGFTVAIGKSLRYLKSIQ